jgi:hypothetical protein
MGLLADRAQRHAQNEAAFRDLNERIADGRDEGENLIFICECSRRNCQSGFVLTIEQYEGVRSAPSRFALVPGHEQAEIERVVEGFDRYLVVEKLEDGGEEAKHLDPRG